MQYRPEIDGIRAIAILSVVLFHANLQIADVKILPGGFLGVDIFFVLSGYLISAIILKSLRSESFNIFDFFERRVRRLIPSLLIVVTFSLVISNFYLDFQSRMNLVDTVYASISFTSNIYFYLENSYWAIDSQLRPLLHTWSLSVEEQFYLFAPFLLILLSKTKKSLMFLITLIIFLVGASHILSIQVKELSFYMPYTRAWEFLCGTLVFLLDEKYTESINYKRKKMLSYLGFILVLLSLIFFNKDTVHPSILTVPLILGVMLLLVSPGVNNNLIVKSLQIWPMRFLGRISYSLYLWHFAVFALYRNLYGQPSIEHVALLLLFSIAISAFSTFYIENIFRDIKLIKRNLLIFILSASYIVILSLTIWIGSSFNQKEISLYDLETGDTKEISLYDLETGDTIVYHTWTETKRKRLITIGDSMMQSIAPTLREIAIKNNIQYASSIFVGCPLVLGVTKYVKSSLKREKQCNSDFAQKRLQFILSSPPSTIVVNSRLPLYLSSSEFINKEYGSTPVSEWAYIYLSDLQDKNTINWQSNKLQIAAQYKLTIDKIINAGHNVILVYPFPELGFNLPKELYQKSNGNNDKAIKLMSSEPFNISYQEFKIRSKDAYELLDSIKHEKVIRVLPENLFCNKAVLGRCETHNSKNLFYKDNVHPSKTGAKLISEMIINAY